MCGVLGGLLGVLEGRAKLKDFFHMDRAEGSGLAPPSLKRNLPRNEESRLKFLLQAPIFHLIHSDYLGYCDSNLSEALDK
jgi:hypothetical protein